jgi:CRP-like cAMP-binding protein
MAAQGVVFADNQVIRLGSMTEARRVAHLLLELHWRLRQAGLGNDVLFPLPLTAETIADALGMAANRVRWALRRLRAQKMFAVRYGRASVLTRRKLDLNGDFRPPDACPCGRAHAVH